MKYLIVLLASFMLFACGTNFYLNKPTVHQFVTFTQGDKSLSLEGDSLIEDDIIRMQLAVDFHKGNAQVIYENGVYDMRSSNLPINEKQKEYLKQDLYAAFYAGDYPFRSDHKMFGKTEMKMGTKSVFAEDGYELYRVLYNGKEIVIHNLVRDYRISIFSDKPIQNMKKD
ncbi:MAG: hypothetical protein AB7E76_10200 [Deferribacterales bacterium]